jgi:hypothetical protein
MTAPDAIGSCLVALLIPHPRRSAVLAAEGESSSGSMVPWRLPSVRVSGTEPTLPTILDAIDEVDLHAGVVLRLITIPTPRDEMSEAPRREKRDLTLMLEFDALDVDAPSGWVWKDADADATTLLEPAAFRGAVESWVDEQITGPSPLRPPWSRPGWFARASDWMLARMSEQGRPATAEPHQHQVWGVSAVVRAPSAEGDVFLKCSAGAFHREALVTRALADAMPEVVPEVIAVEADEGWLLMRDLDALELGEQDQSRWHVGLTSLAGIQRSWTDRTDEMVALGLPIRSLTELAQDVEEIAADGATLSRLPIDVRERWLVATPTLIEFCRRLDRIGPSPTLVHGDFHPWNVASGPTATRVFDWTDAAISHPFVDVVTYVLRTDDIALRRSLLDGYLDAWAEEMPGEVLSEAAELALVVGALYQVQTYRRLLPTLLGHGADDEMLDGDVEWMKLTLGCLEQGIETPAW